MNKILLSGLLSILIFAANFSFSQTYYQEISQEAGISHPGLNRGAIVSDFNNDGHDDIFVARINKPNLLYQNKGDNSFSEVAAELGLDFAGNSNTAVWGDLDNDGWQDLYVGTRQQANLLYHNNGDGTFTEIGLDAGVNALGNPRSIHLVDINTDGLLDIYIANLGEQNALFQNLGNMRFVNKTREANIWDNKIAQAAIFFDYDNDGDQDLYLTHDAYQANIMYQNDGTGYFIDVSEASNTNIEIQSMGVDVGDINHDGWLDMYVTNLGKNVVLMNNRDGTFSIRSEETGLIDLGMGWGNCFLDFDNDGFIDVYTANDSYFSPYPNVLQRNLGNDTFEIVDAHTPIESWGGSYGTASLDINKDGLLDLFLANTGSDGNQLFLNITSNPGNYLNIKARGTRSNRDAIGTKITLEAEGRIFTDEINAGSGFASQNSLTLHFGLGNLKRIDKLTVVWPNGNQEIYTDLPVNATLRLIEEEGLFNDGIAEYASQLWPNPATDKLNIMLEIQESQFVDIQILGFKGDILSTIIAEELSGGYHEFEWKTEAIGAGIYFVKIISDQGVEVKKFVVKSH